MTGLHKIIVWFPIVLVKENGSRESTVLSWWIKLGELKELSEELRSLDKAKKKDAVKKTIAAMTVGKDVEKLFPDVVNCMQTEDLELKKLVYLYLINYSKSQPDLAIMAVNTFVKVWIPCRKMMMLYLSYLYRILVK